MSTPAAGKPGYFKGSEVEYRDTGRSAWNIQGKGGTLDVKGLKPGPYYRAPAQGSLAQMPGLSAAMAVRSGSSVLVDDLAVHIGVRSLQGKIGATQDGILGPKSDAAIKAWQKAHGLVADGVPGPKTFRAMFEPDVRKAGRAHGSDVEAMLIGHVGHESTWDPGAVGYSTPQDLGFFQLSGKWHPETTEEFRLDPATAAPYAAEEVKLNLDYHRGDLDAGIISYNIGRGGAALWVKAGRPQWFYKVDTHAYIASVKKWMQA